VESLTIGGVQSGLVGHGAFRVSELCSGVHGEASCSASEPVSLGPELPAVALLAE